MTSGTDSAATRALGPVEWAVVMLAREPAPLVLANIAWHLAAGATQVFLYLDDPRDPVAAVAAALPRVVVTLCDRAFWRTLAGRRPALQTRRQSLVATHAYRARQTGWLLHIDADEFVWPADGLAADLAMAPADAIWLHLPVLERYWLSPAPQTLFEGAFMAPLPPGKPASDAARAPYLARGVAGHVAGKGCTRCGLPAELLPHAPRLHGLRPPAATADHSRILHFDGVTPLHWLLKLLRYAAHAPAQWERFLGPHRRAQLHHVRAHQHDPAALRAFLDLLKRAPFPMHDRLVRLPFDPVPAMQAVLAAPPSLDVEHFDALLRAAEPMLAQGL
ncbi:MAG: glycosyltransferase family 2 protein [Pararhodobacter sp.]|nr:glycosyltransferase family 2 protein [Pararhodobacter sp.]